MNSLDANSLDMNAPLDVHYYEYPASNYTFGTPASSPTRSPEPEADSEDLRKTVELMAKIHEEDQKILEEIIACRRVAGKARHQAEALKKRAASARAVRQRLQTYAAYWRWFSPHWTYEEVWKGPMRVKRHGPTDIEVTSSDEEQMDGLIEAAVA